LEGQFPELRAIVALENYDKQTFPSIINKFLSDSSEYILPYFKTTRLYFVNDEVLKNMALKGKSQIAIDYSFMLDTNICSYVNKIVHGKKIGNLQKKVSSLIHDIIYHDLNFDHMFYMIENLKQVNPINLSSSVSKLGFWKSLDKNFRTNLVSLHLFKTVDNEAFKKEFIPKFKSTYIDAARNAVNYTYDFYMSEIGKDKTYNYLWLQRLTLLNLIGMLKIQLSSKKSAKNKMNDYFLYMNDVVGVYLDREAIIAYKYFENRNNFRMLDKINKGRVAKQLLKKLDNIAWDLVSPRIMEQLIVDLSGEKFFIPFFLTADADLKQLISLFPIKAEVFSKKGDVFTPLPVINSYDFFKSVGCEKVAIHYLFGPMKSLRLSQPQQTIGSIHKKIIQQYRELRKAIQKVK
jgi:hypothetical protein